MSRLAIIGRRPIRSGDARLVRAFRLALDGTLSPARPPVRAVNLSRLEAEAGKPVVLTPATIDDKRVYIITAIEC